GTSPDRYRTLRRLEHARSAIENGRSLAQASAEAGFADQSHMTRQFKRTYGLTPARWMTFIAAGRFRDALLAEAPDSFRVRGPNAGSGGVGGARVAPGGDPGGAGAADRRGVLQPPLDQRRLTSKAPVAGHGGGVCQVSDPVVDEQGPGGGGPAVHGSQVQPGALDRGHRRVERHRAGQLVLRQAVPGQENR